MKRYLMIMLVAVGAGLFTVGVGEATTNVTITVTCPTCVPVGGDLQVCPDATCTTSGGTFNAVSDASGGLTFYALPGCVIGPYSIAVSSPNSSLTADTAALNVVAGPLVRLAITSGKNQTVPVKAGTTAIAVAGADKCGNKTNLP